METEKYTTLLYHNCGLCAGMRLDVLSVAGVTSCQEPHVQCAASSVHIMYSVCTPLASPLYICAKVPSSEHSGRLCWGELNPWTVIAQASFPPPIQLQ